MSLPALAGKDLITFDEPKLELIRRTVAKELSAPEFELFMGVSRARGLDPILGQIHAVKRSDGEGSRKMVLQVSIDGGRLIAARTGEYAGNDAPIFSRDENDGLVASVTIYRLIGGQRVPFTGTAYWSEFYPGDKLGFMWKKMPRTMLAKCAEMQALRKGFPNDLSGLYGQEEIEREVPEEPAASPHAPALVSSVNEERAEKITKLIAKFRQIAVSEKMICAKFKLKSVSDLTGEQFVELNGIGAAIVENNEPVEMHFPGARA